MPLQMYEQMYEPKHDCQQLICMATNALLPDFVEGNLVCHVTNICRDISMMKGADQAPSNDPAPPPKTC